MQKIIKVFVTVHEYIASPSTVFTDENRRCPICPNGHRLRSHGHYFRTVILPGGETKRIMVLRLLCAANRRTVSLLPDFCIPRRQHGPAVLGLLLEAMALTGLTLVAAMKVARPDAPPGHSLPQSLLRGFKDRLGGTRTWLAQKRARIPSAPDGPDDPSVPKGGTLLPLEVRLAVAAIRQHGDGTEAAFIHVGRGVHDLTGLGIA